MSETATVEAPSPRRTTYAVKPEDFIKTWEAAESVEAAAETLQIPVNAVLSRAASYRKSGVNIKQMRKKRASRINVAALNAIIAGVRTS